MLIFYVVRRLSDIVKHLAVAGQRPVILTADGLGIVGSGTQGVHHRENVIVEGNGLLALGGQCLCGIHGILQGVDGIAHGIGVRRKLFQSLGLAAHADVLADSQLGGGGIGNFAHVGVDGGQQLLAGHLQHGQSLDVDDLGVVLHFHLVAARHLHLGQHAELFHQGDVLGLDQCGQSSGGILLVGQAALGCLGLPLGGIAVAVEDNAAMVADGALDQSDGCAGKVLSALQLIGVALQLLGDSGVK